ncbi:MAG: FmdB family zinc ribbon protein [Dehalococcoidia bacterium]
MPRYDYRCEAGHKYERQEPFGSPVEHPCDRCGRPARRLLVAPPLVFKSGGFYKTSSRSESRGSGSDRAKKSEKTPPAGADSSPSTAPTPTPTHGEDG